VGGRERDGGDGDGRAPKVASHVERLVVAVEDVHSPARLLRALRQLPQQPQNADLVVAAVQDVAHLHQGGVATHPLRRLAEHGGCHQAGHLQHPHGLHQVPVEVADCAHRAVERSVSCM